MDRRREQPVSISTARIASSVDLHNRQTRYLISMAIRTICFVGGVVTTGPLRWALFAGAIFLPYVAVILANVQGRREVPSPEQIDVVPYAAIESATQRDDQADTR